MIIMTKLFNSLLLLALSFSTLQANKNELSATIVGYGDASYIKNNTGASVLITQGDTAILVDMGYSTEEDLQKLGVDSSKLSALLFTQKTTTLNLDLYPNKHRKIIAGETFFINDIKISTLKTPNSPYEISYRFDCGEKSIIVTGNKDNIKALSKFAKNSDFVIINSSGNVRIAFNQFH